MKSKDYAGQTVLITGGTKGVGEGITKSFLENGASVVICGRVAPKTPIAIEGNEALYFQADVRNLQDLQNLVQFTKKETGRLDVLVNNAGGSPEVEAATVSPRFSEAILQLNLVAPLNLSQLSNQIMQDQSQGGCIINISSVSGVRPSPGTAAYGAAKAGLLNLTQSLAIEWSPKVRLNSIIAGPILTDQSQLHFGDENSVARVAKTIPMERLALPSDIGSACLFLASPQASYITGSSLTIHGGGEKPAFLQVRE